MKPLEGYFVLDFTQYLAGPSASLRLADLGAEVVKVEQPGGDSARRMYTSKLRMDGENSLFHAVNRNKRGISLNLKSEEDREKLVPLLKRADVVLLNYRPGVAERLGLSYDQVRSVHPGIVYGEITGYGYEGPWAQRPGQDLLVQAVSGMCMANGNREQLPTPIGLSAADMVAGQHLVQGVMAGLLKAKRTGESVRVQVSLLESMMDLQFEGFTTFLNDGHETPRRSGVSNANLYTSAPYGIYATKDGYIAMAMTPIPQLGELIGCQALTRYTDPASWSNQRDEIKGILAEHLRTQTTGYWLEILQPKDIWCSDVYTWDELMKSEAFQALNMVQKVKLQSGKVMETLRCPITIDHEYFVSERPAPHIGQDQELYLR